MAAPASSAARITSGLHVSTDSGTLLPGKRLDHRQHPPHFLVDADRLRAGAGGFAADVEDIGALFQQLKAHVRSPAAADA